MWRNTTKYDDCLPPVIPENTFYHITYLIEEAKNLGKKVGVFPIDDDDWIDIGEWTEYQNAIKLLK